MPLDIWQFHDWKCSYTSLWSVMFLLEMTTYSLWFVMSARTDILLPKGSKTTTIDVHLPYMTDFRTVLTYCFVHSHQVFQRHVPDLVIVLALLKVGRQNIWPKLEFISGDRLDNFSVDVIEMYRTGTEAIVM